MREEATVYDSTEGRSIDYDISNPIIGGLRFYVDGKRYFDVPLPDVRPSTGRHNYQILKFSPHFEELLASQFLFEPTPEHLDTISESEINELKCDKDNNLYLVVSSNYLLTETGESNRLKIGGSDSLWLRFLEYDHNKGFLVKYDSTLNPVYLRYFERDSTLELNGPAGLASGLRASHFDEEGNLVFVGGATASDSLITSCYFGGNEVELNKMFVRINPEDGSGVTFGDRMRSEMVAIGSNDIVDVIAKNNRIIQQVKYRWWLDFAGERYEKAEAYVWGIGFAVWDYDGNELCFVDYGINGSLNNGIRSICLVDSVLYLTGMLASGGAQFGNVTVPNSGSSQSFIARYVDTAFMHPYVRPGGQQDIQLVVRGGEPVATVYPNPCAQRVTVDWNGDEPPLAATVTDITGRTYSVTLSASGQGRYTVDFSSLPAANYLLTITTPSGHSVTSRLMKR
ncbi:MAG: T9SS type A sorting domain-containing protein [Bacteroidales bacterium]|nr:T9SS type A sorting domain-containing protein [Bacteroidales bacterium]